MVHQWDGLLKEQLLAVNLAECSVAVMVGYWVALKGAMMVDLMAVWLVDLLVDVTAALLAEKMAAWKVATKVEKLDWSARWKVDRTVHHLVEH